MWTLYPHLDVEFLLFFLLRVGPRAPARVCIYKYIYTYVHTYTQPVCAVFGCRICCSAFHSTVTLLLLFGRGECSFHGSVQTTSSAHLVYAQGAFASADIRRNLSRFPRYNICNNRNDSSVPDWISSAGSCATRNGYPIRADGPLCTLIIIITTTTTSRRLDEITEGIRLDFDPAAATGYMPS